MVLPLNKFHRNGMKNQIKHLLHFLLFGTLTFSCSNSNDSNSYPKESVWNDSLSNELLKRYSSSAFESFVITDLIDKYQYDSSYQDLSQYLESDKYSDLLKSNKRSFKLHLDELAGKSPEEVKKILGKPNKTEKVNPRGTPCPCTKNYYLFDVVEIVFINGKADWITANNIKMMINTGSANFQYKSIDQFDDYTYIKAFTD